ncbi:MAG: hypothetical protein HYT70_03130 [Candidatus Aenigmarchaeota archaeon]|nr:hypothetical protein [Candidatus Aenigmarchaeota archaeon]
MDGKDVLIFDMPRDARIGDTVNFRVYVDSSVYNGSSVKVNYTKEKIVREPDRYDETVNTEMLTLAEVPLNREVTLKFNPSGSGSYKFFLPGVTFFEPDVRWPKATTSSAYENEGLIGSVCFGRPAQVSVKSDVRETMVDSTVLLSVDVSPAAGEYGQLRVKISREGSIVDEFVNSSKTSRYLVNWIPAQPGVYDIVAKSDYSCLFDGYIPTTSNSIKVSVRAK